MHVNFGGLGGPPEYLNSKFFRERQKVRHHPSRPKEPKTPHKFLPRKSLLTYTKQAFGRHWHGPFAGMQAVVMETSTALQMLSLCPMKNGHLLGAMSGVFSTTCLGCWCVDGVRRVLSQTDLLGQCSMRSSHTWCGSDRLAVNVEKTCLMGSNKSSYGISLPRC